MADTRAYCTCREEGVEGEEMIECDGPACPIEWFHLRCVGLGRAPRGAWLCPACDGPKRRRDEFIPDDDKGPPLKVASAERQSRAIMEAMLQKAKWLTFDDGRLRNPTPEVEGLCKVRVDDATFGVLRALHELIVDRLAAERRLTPWAGVSEGDGRRRGYAFLPSSIGTFGKTALRAAGVRFHAFGKSGSDAARDEDANWRSCVRLKEADLTEDHRDALDVLAMLVRDAVPPRYKACIRLDNLQALQPNLHNGLDHLPCHIDHPLNDGFGVVIVTLCISSSASVLLVPEHDARPRAFDANQGDAYVLAGAARNACDHGIVCPLAPTRRQATRGSHAKSRESLNLRFGLHSSKPGDPYYAFDEMPILRDVVY